MEVKENNEDIAFGGAAKAIEHHYDVGNDFFKAWLDPTLTYSCALWDGISQGSSLEEAQRNKLRFHADCVHAAPGMRILDVGCGWGAMMRTLLDEYSAAECFGLTLSKEQFTHINSLGTPSMKAELLSWKDYIPEKPFDAVISIGAFEHFAHPEQNIEERRHVYRTFFERCREWTDAKGWLSLQTIAYANMVPSEANPFITREIFPDAELPTLEDIKVASKGLFRVDRVRDDGLDYARTCEIWSRQLRAASQAGALDPHIHPVAKYSRYLRMSAAGFRMRKITLLRLSFGPV